MLPERIGDERKKERERERERGDGVLAPLGSSMLMSGGRAGSVGGSGAGLIRTLEVAKEPHSLL